MGIEIKKMESDEEIKGKAYVHWKSWQEWFESGHEYGARDKEFLDRGLYDILNFLLIYVRKGK